MTNKDKLLNIKKTLDNINVYNIRSSNIISFIKNTINIIKVIYYEYNLIPYRINITMSNVSFICNNLSLPEVEYKLFSVDKLKRNIIYKNMKVRKEIIIK